MVNICPVIVPISTKLNPRRQSVIFYLGIGGILFYMPLCYLRLMQANFAAVTKHCRTEALHAERNSLDRRNQLSGGTLWSSLSNNHRGLPVCLLRACRQPSTTGPVRSSHVLRQHLIIIIPTLFEQSGKTL